MPHTSCQCTVEDARRETDNARDDYHALSADAEGLLAALDGNDAEGVLECYIRLTRRITGSEPLPDALARVRGREVCAVT